MLKSRVGLVVLIAVVLIAGVMTGASAGRSRVALSILARIDSISQGPARQSQMTCDIIIQTTRAHGSRDSSAIVNSGGRARSVFQYVNGCAATVPLRAVIGLSNNPNVEFISTDAPVRANLDYTTAAVGLDSNCTSDGNRAYEFTGDGMVIAVLGDIAVWGDSVLAGGDGPDEPIADVPNDGAAVAPAGGPSAQNVTWGRNRRDHDREFADHNCAGCGTYSRGLHPLLFPG